MAFLYQQRNNIVYGSNYKSGNSPITDAALICANYFQFPRMINRNSLP
jgi:hypothetical protein